MATIPAGTKTAAKRAFLRTAAQTLASVIPAGTISVVLTGDWLVGVGLGALSAVVSSLLAGTAAALDILAKGIPGDYQAATAD